MRRIWSVTYNEYLYVHSNVWDMCGTYVGVCACVGEQHSKQSKSFPFPFSFLRNVQQSVSVSPFPIVVYPDSFVEREGEAFGHACQCVGPWLIGLSTGSGNKWVLWECKKWHKNHLHLHLIHTKRLRSETTTNFAGVFAFTECGRFLTTIQKFGVCKFFKCFWSLMLTKAAFNWFDQKYSKIVVMWNIIAF